mmetsp:Transcript_37129/g.95892  ORF Transcript_37129/g.95892 Transcript_37129/m.95892 type:complete len:275 (-) Transcript_37129:1118-1942(-)
MPITPEPMSLRCFEGSSSSAALSWKTLPSTLTALASSVWASLYCARAVFAWAASDCRTLVASAVVLAASARSERTDLRSSVSCAISASISSMRSFIFCTSFSRSSLDVVLFDISESHHAECCWSFDCSSESLRSMLRTKDLTLPKGSARVRTLEREPRRERSESSDSAAAASSGCSSARSRPFRGEVGRRRRWRFTSASCTKEGASRWTRASSSTGGGGGAAAALGEEAGSRGLDAAVRACVDLVDLCISLLVMICSASLTASVSSARRAVRAL